MYRQLAALEGNNRKGVVCCLGTDVVGSQVVVVEG
jgi:hypothetical protein